MGMYLFTESWNKNQIMDFTTDITLGQNSTFWQNLTFWRQTIKNKKRPSPVTRKGYPVSRMRTLFPKSGPVTKIRDMVCRTGKPASRVWYPVFVRDLKNGTLLHEKRCTPKYCPNQTLMPNFRETGSLFWKQYPPFRKQDRVLFFISKNRVSFLKKKVPHLRKLACTTDNCMFSKE